MVILYNCGTVVPYYNNVDFNKQIDRKSRVTQNKPYRQVNKAAISSPKKTPYYVLIIPNAFSNLLCSNLCRHNVHRPSDM